MLSGMSAGGTVLNVEAKAAFAFFCARRRLEKSTPRPDACGWENKNIIRYEHFNEPAPLGAVSSEASF